MIWAFSAQALLHAISEAPDMGGGTDEAVKHIEKLLEQWPALPIEEDGRLNDPVLRENFIERVFSRNRWRGQHAGV